MGRIKPILSIFRCPHNPSFSSILRKAAPSYRVAFFRAPFRRQALVSSWSNSDSSKLPRVNEVVLWTNVIVFLGCWAVPMLAQPPKQPDSAGRTPAPVARSAAEQSVAPQSTTTLPANTYPLDSFPDFSAVMFGSRAEPGEGVSQGHIYRSGKLLRMEEPGRRAYFITDLSTGETFGIMETACIQDDHPYIRAIPFRIAGKADATVTRAPAGTDTVDGHSCQIENITLSSPELAGPMKMKFWEAEDLQGFPLKIEFLLPGGHGPIIRYKNVILGPQDPTLFLHPKSCQQLPQPDSAPPAAKKPSAE